MTALTCLLFSLKLLCKSAIVLKREQTSLLWWRAFDDIKHNRYGNIKKANQKNTLNTLAALYLLEMKAFKQWCQKDSSGNPTEPDIPNPQSKLFSPENWISSYLSLSNAFAVTNKP